MTPICLDFKVDWKLFHQFYKRLLPIELQICTQIGVSEEMISMY